ncbi:MAG: hypothetical protein KKH04_09320 [Proteobacteria bacterium]|nr:hypothetical protein [Pseudomonadota bacterium]
MTQNNVCAYLDVLGFKSYIFKDLRGALGLLNDCQSIIHSEFIERRIHPPESYTDATLRTLAERHALSSFDYLLPFSDSIFIRSSNPDLFVAQISTFLLRTFLVKSHAFDIPESSEEPSKVTMKYFDLEEGKISISESYWFPGLFQGGISFGECVPVQINSLVNNEMQPITNLVGKAVVEAVQLQGSIEGPRLICSQSFYQALSDKHERYVIKVDKGYEILWPAFAFIEGNDVKLELINQFGSLFRPAVNLWKAFNHLDSGIHYYNFLKLIVRSTLHYFSFNREDLKLAQEHIITKLAQKDLQLKTRDLMGSHYT